MAEEEEDLPELDYADPLKRRPDDDEEELPALDPADPLKRDEDDELPGLDPIVILPPES